MDLWEFVTALLYEYDFFYCICAFTLLLCFWDMQIQLVARYIVSCAVCFTVTIIWHLYQRAQDRLREQRELDNIPPLTDRLIQRTIKEQWNQLMLDYHSADPRKIIPHPETGLLMLNHHARDYVHYSNPLYEIPIRTAGDILPWSFPYSQTLQYGTWRREQHIYLMGSESRRIGRITDPNAHRCVDPPDAALVEREVQALLAIAHEFSFIRPEQQGKQGGKGGKGKERAKDS